MPTGATHFRLVNAVSAISDYAFNAEPSVYEPKVADQNGVSGMSYTDYLNVKVPTEAISLKVKLLNDLEPSADVAVLNAVGIEFFQHLSRTRFGKVGNYYYLFASVNAMQLVDVF